MGDAWGHPFVKQGQEVLWPPIVRIPEWRVRAGGVQWPVMPSKGDAGRCRGVYVAHKSDTARDASRRERNFLIGKSCESPRLKGVPFVKQCSSNHLPQRWAQARAEQGNAAAGIGPIASSFFMLSLEGKVSGRQRIGQGHRLESVDPWRGSTFPWRGKVKQTKIAESSSRWFFPGGGGSPPEHKLTGRAAFGYEQLACPLSDAHP